MNREIKFRAWDGSQMYQSPSEIQHIGKWFDSHAPGALVSNDKLVFMQFTGLKDKNGKEIYEGDIAQIMVSDDDIEIDYDAVPFNPPLKKEVSTIQYRWHGFWVKDENFWYEGEDLWDWDEIEVIGNIYENPELLTTQNL